MFFENEITSSLVSPRDAATNRILSDDGIVTVIEKVGENYEYIESR